MCVCSMKKNPCGFPKSAREMKCGQVNGRPDIKGDAITPRQTDKIGVALFRLTKLSKGLITMYVKIFRKSHLYNCVITMKQNISKESNESFRKFVPTIKVTGIHIPVSLSCFLSISKARNDRTKQDLIAPSVV